MTRESFDIDPEVKQIGNKEIKYYCTRGDGDCFFHAAFGREEVYVAHDEESHRAYLTHNAQKMREELVKFFRDNIDLLEERLGLVWRNITDYVKNHPANLGNTDKYDDLKCNYSESNEEAKAKYREAYLMLLKDQGYNIHEMEMLYIASISNTRITLYFGDTIKPQIFEPDQKIVEKVGEINTELWGNQREVTIFHKGVSGIHFYKAEVTSDDTKQPKLQESETDTSRISSDYPDVVHSINDDVQSGTVKQLQVSDVQEETNGGAPRSTKGNKLPIITAFIGSLLGPFIAYLAGAATLTPLNVAVAMFIVSAAIGALVGYSIGKVSSKFLDTSITVPDPKGQGV